MHCSIAESDRCYIVQSQNSVSYYVLVARPPGHRRFKSYNLTIQLHGCLNVSDRMGEVEALAYELDLLETVVASKGENGNKQR